MFDKEGIIDHLRELEDASKDWKRFIEERIKKEEEYNEKCRN